MEKTPIWLDFKKEYIDDYFAKLQKYLRQDSRTGVRSTMIVLSR